MIRSTAGVLLTLLVAACSGGAPASPAPSATPTLGITTMKPATPTVAGTAAPTTAPSAPGSLSPAAGFGATVPLLSDDFSDTSGGWFTTSATEGSVQYVEEKLQLDISQNFSFLSLSRVLDASGRNVMRADGTITVTDGYIGLLCAQSADDLAGAVMATTGLYTFVRRTGGGTFEVLAPAQSTTRLNEFDEARMSVECAGTNTGSLRIRLSLDGAFVAEYETDAGPRSFSSAGIYVEAIDGSVFSLDDVEVYGGAGDNLPPPATNPPPGQTPQASETPNARLEQLLSQVPAEIRAGECHETAAFDLGASVGAQCINIPAVDGYAAYTQFDTLANLNAAYQSDLDFWGEGATGSDCSVGPSEGPYTIDGATAGRLMCNAAPDLDPDALIMQWTNEALLIEATLVNYSGSYADMYADWQMAGPVESATPGPGASVQPGGDSWNDSAGQFRGREGERFAYNCPPGGTELPVYGTDAYTDDSFVCTAAVHAGLITLAGGGDVVIEMRPGQDSYVGSDRNGISSNNWGSWDGSFIFVR